MKETVVPNPRSPETPMVETFMATAYNTGHTATLRFVLVDLALASLEPAVAWLHG